MKKFEGILICTDLDGTLMKNDKTISEKTIQAIEYFKANGGFFTFITGRMHMIVSDILEKVKPNAPIGCNNGSVYDYIERRYIWKEDLSCEVIELADYVDISIPAIGIQFNTENKIYFNKDNSSMELYRKVTGLPYATCDYHNLKESIMKVLFSDADMGNMAKLSEILAKHPLAEKFDFVRSESFLYEVLPKGINKATALTKIVEHLNLDMNKTISVGDYDNDIEMIKAAKIGIAVSNAQKSVKEAADCITVSNEEDAIAQIIEDLDAGKIRF